MAYLRTQIYLEPDQHRRLKEEAHRRGISLAGLLRTMVQEALGRSRHSGDLSSLIGLGESVGSDVTNRKDEYLAQAISDHLLR